MSKRILFFGNERLATGVTTTAPTLRALVEAGYDVAAVVIAQNQVNTSRNTRELEIATVANNLQIPIVVPAKLSQAKDELAAFGAELGVLVAFGKLVPKGIIDLFSNGIINIHPSLLPKHRGPTPLESVILAGDKETGVSLMKLVEAMDAGPVYAQETLLLSGSETKQQLADSLSQLGSQMLIQHLPHILDGLLEAIEQVEAVATYDEKIAKSDAKLDFVNKSAEQLEREIRAYAGWPRSKTTIGTTEVIITAAHIGDTQGTAGTLWLEGPEIGVYAKEGVLIIDTLIPAGKKEMPAQAFLAGYKPI